VSANTSQQQVKMSPPTLIEMWEADAKFDDTELDTESFKIPILHAKYLKILSQARLWAKRCHYERRELFAKLRDYYLGNLNGTEELKTMDRPPMLVRHLKNEVHTHIEADTELIKQDARIAIAEESCAVAEEILKAINNRGYQIKNAIEWRKLTQFGQ